MRENLIEQIEADLEKSGFSSELQARRALINKGWSVNAGYNFLDLDEDKSREIDILATRAVNLKRNNKIYTYTEFHICAEVKKSEKPWIVFDQQKHPV